MQTLLLLVSLSWLGASGHAADAIPEDSALVQLLQADGDVLTVKWDSDGLRERHQSKRRFVLEGLPISATRRVDMELTPFSVAGPDTRFVLGRSGAPDEPFLFDTSRVRAFRGTVKDRAGSDVLVVFGDVQTTGYIDLGAGRNRFLLSSKDKNGLPLPDGMTSVFPAGNVTGYQPPVPYCGVDKTILPAGARPVHDAGVLYVGSEPARGFRHVELAAESDYAYFTLFGDRDAATEYLVQMYAQVSHIFLRDARARFELVFVRLWDDPIGRSGRFADDGGVGGIAFGGPVTFDLAQFVSGSRHAAYGGMAWGGLCGGGVASAIYYVQGFFPDPTIPSPYDYDISVAAHELGHNAGAPHTHDVGIDDCADPSATPQRGSIMSYCQQSYSGLNANQDLYFHRQIAAGMIRRFQSAGCVVEDCNLNDRDDALDILHGSSADVNGNAVPDECEDCNSNGVLDDEDIASGASNDINGNAIPDECEPDCNGNGIPDLTDIANGTSNDLYGNAVPDECETDCNGNGISDYTEIQGDMSKDVDRNAALDACQDCDSDGTTDHAALNGAHNLWVASGLPAAPLREFFATTGVLVRTSTGPLVSEGQDVVIAPDGRILVSSAGTNRIQAFDRGGMFIEDFVPPGTLGMNYPTGMLVLPDGRLLVASRDTDNVLAFEAITGAPLGEFVSAGSGGLSGPHGLTLGPNGNVFVASETNEIIEYDGLDGAFVRVFVSASANGGLFQPRDLVFKRDGQLLVTSFGTDEVLEYNGLTGRPIGSWAVLGFAVSGMTPVNPWGIEIGPNGNVFVSRALSDPKSTSDAGPGGEPLHLSNAKVFEYDVCNGNFARVHVGGSDLDLAVPTGFAFIPGWDADCNFNLVPDACDIANGTSDDCEPNGIPDDCEPDCNNNGVADRCDITDGTSHDCNANDVPDECEPDCNENEAADGCDIADGTSLDEDGNGIPDECQFALFVDADAPAAGDGLTWAGGLNELQAALGVAANTDGLVTQIRVAEGIYTPAGPDGDRTATFRLRDWLPIRGGYAGFGAPDPDERDISAYETILSGDLNGDDGPDFENNAENSYHVVIGGGADATALLDGFTITAGNADDWDPFHENSRGGGMYNSRSSPTLANCTFTRNWARLGAGMYNLEGSSPILGNCVFSGNSASLNGGGMHNWDDSNPTLTNCTFAGNSAGRGDGGGMYSSLSSSPTVNSCILWDNSPNGIVDGSGALTTVLYSDVQGGWPGEGNIDGDPLFVDADGPDDIPGTEDDNLRLSPGSPCINAGDPDFVPEPGDTDLHGHPRVLCTRVDMGAYEFGIGDYDCDQVVNLTDFAAWQTCMTGPHGGPYDVECEAFDFNADDHVDLTDFAGFQSALSAAP